MVDTSFSPITSHPGLNLEKTKCHPVVLLMGNTAIYHRFHKSRGRIRYNLWNTLGHFREPACVCSRMSTAALVGDALDDAVVLSTPARKENTAACATTAAVALSLPRRRQRWWRSHSMYADMYCKHLALRGASRLEPIHQLYAAGSLCCCLLVDKKTRQTELKLVLSWRPYRSTSGMYISYNTSSSAG